MQTDATTRLENSAGRPPARAPAPSARDHTNTRCGALAPEAARVIHTDLERGFIRAETCSFDELMAAGSLVELKKSGKLRLEGKSYQVRDGDILNIRFSV